MPLEIPELLESKTSIIEKNFADLSHPLIDWVKKLTLVSDYAFKHIPLLKNILIEDECAKKLSRDNNFYAIKQIPLTLPQVNFARELRQFRHTHFLRLLLLKLAGVIDIEEEMSSWSDCADALILHTISYCMDTLSSLYGMPRDKAGNEVELFILAMGKLGGRELNYSSDIDVIFAYSAVGQTDGEEPIDNELFFSKTVQQFTHLLQTVTPEGFVFRVDLRLRPNGESGTLVSSLSAMETYYQEQGRDWERYAMVKARVITAPINKTPPWFARLIIPFVYRRYVDFSVIESLRSMKAMIEREIQLNPRLDDIKRGKGGIREIEFIIQNFQLIRGGRLPQLQKQNALEALATLSKAGLIHHSAVLKQAYLFLRQLENRLQSLNDQQTHSLPDDPIKQTQITWSMGYTSWGSLLDKLHQYQRIVRYAFHAVLGKVDYYEDEKRLLANQFLSLWQGHVEQDMAINLLSSLNFENADYCYQMIHAFRHSPRCRRLTQAARMRLDRFMVLLLSELPQVKKTDAVLLNVMHLLENIVGRSAYLALLTENTQVLKELLFWFAHSSFITSLLVNQPFLLEVLLDQGSEWCPQSRTELTALLQEHLSHYQDIEAQEEMLRQFKLTHWLMAARAELFGFSSAVRIGQFLADVAQVILSQVVVIASQHLSVRYPEMKRLESDFAIVAYGKLGSREMNYTSDLDLVFLHSVSLEDEVLVTRLTQKILHMLTTRSQSGILYATDTRLRPSGAAGLLVSHVDAFVAYQKNHAWTWEHQALLKARLVSGNPSIKHKLLQLKKEVLLLPREKQFLQNEVLSMRAKIEPKQENHLLKYLAGGLLDLEFLVQFLGLHSQSITLARSTHTLSQLKHLYSANILTKEQYMLLKKAYRHYHHLLHQELLSPGSITNEKIQSDVLAIYQHFLIAK